MLSLIVARAQNGIIGQGNGLPWRLSTDQKYFKRVTTGHVVLMGRKTYESIPSKWRPLPDRRNIILSRQDGYSPEGAEVIQNLEQLQQITRPDEIVFVAGGAEIYALTLPIADRLLITEVCMEAEGDVFFPPFELSNWKLVRKDFQPRQDKDDCDMFFTEYVTIR
ncbi:MAG: hypothetical protein A2571_01115 [Candidatus Vogelbacteria bacterium RIFOXYD1_FULL_44_32]|uniref:Dihydrofolate reductase n=1 Tax=Candidatus Vogelbacteria bacterium RIFOXYD1_FULL_44_32 TaxID=1802438 RepID=A0A1G2QFX5_9BACT|nr:MAG: hypothetical protein A2571_01115 [Candidatus Vogelbacteria bacterium RIFOXYD1_FULL_44_32]